VEMAEPDEPTAGGRDLCPAQPLEVTKIITTSYIASPSHMGPPQLADCGVATSIWTR
jgi:hypothetical protein